MPPRKKAKGMGHHKAGFVSLAPHFLLFFLLPTSAHACQLFGDRFQLHSSGSLSVPKCALGQLNDTGITACSDRNTIQGECSINGYPAQDAESGRDYLYKTGTLPKLGNGVAGFDFSRVDANGNTLPPESTDWACIQDNHTGLLWEVKVDSPAHPRHKDHSYTWSEVDQFISDVNTSSLCGYTDWRLPTVEELLTIVHNGEPLINKIDDFYFPHNQNTYWTDTSVASSGDRAWIVAFVSGYTARWFKSNTAHIRAVRSNGSTASSNHEPLASNPNNAPRASDFDNDFTLLGIGMAKQTSTGLVWSRCLIGQQWKNGGCTGTAEELTWEEALIAVQNYTLNEFSDWRLPNKNELASIIRWSEWSPAIDTNIFPATPSSYHWTSSPMIWSTPGYAWAVDFSEGYVSFDSMDFSFYARPVRDP